MRPSESEEKIRRTAEREGRRRARRLKREAGGVGGAGGGSGHREGDSSDDELPPTELQHDRHERGRHSLYSRPRTLFACISCIVLYVLVNVCRGDEISRDGTVR